MNQDRKPGKQEDTDLDFTKQDVPATNATPADEHGTLAERILRHAQTERDRKAGQEESAQEAAAREAAAREAAAREAAAREAAAREVAAREAAAREAAAREAAAREAAAREAAAREAAAREAAAREAAAREAAAREATAQESAAQEAAAQEAAAQEAAAQEAAAQKAAAQEAAAREAAAQEAAAREAAAREAEAREQARAEAQRQAEEAKRAEAIRRSEEAKRAAAARAARAQEARERRRAALARARAAVMRLRRTMAAWRPALAQWSVLFAALGLITVHLVPFTGMVPRIEQAAAARFGQPVKIASVHLWLLPLPHWRLDDVTIGDAGQLKAPLVKAVIDLSSLFSDDLAYQAVELDAPTLNDEALGWLLFGTPQRQGVSLGRIEAAGARLASRHLTLPAFDATAQIDRNGRWRRLALTFGNRNMRAELRPDDGRIRVDFRADAFEVPFGAALTLDDFKAEGSATRDELVLTEFSARVHGGTLTGRAQLNSSGPWALDGSIEVKDLDAARVVPRLAESGRIDGRALFAMQADEAEKLFAAPRAQGDFVVRKGALLGVDLGRLLQGDSIGGKTLFASLDGTFQREAGTTQLRQVRLAAGILAARGNAEVDANRNLRGRFAVELAYRHVRARGTLTVAGTLDFPRFSR